MPNTVPNQRLVAIHRERASSDFLGIKNSHWQAAARDLGAHALMLYLYFASNANGFMLALSPAAIRQAVGMPSSTYRDQFVRLVDKGYLVQRGDSNTYDFYETPQRATHTEKDETDSVLGRLRQENRLNLGGSANGAIAGCWCCFLWHSIWLSAIFC